jgi:YggT family protein
MPSTVTSAVVFIVNSLAQLYLLVLLLRLLLPWLGADFRNPIVQAILKLTSPVVVPLRRIIPPVGRLDTATVLVAIIVQYLTIVVLLMITGAIGQAGFVPIAITTVVNLVILVLNLFVFAILIRVVLSWISPGGYNPAVAIINTLTDPVLRPFRRIIPPLGGLDLSPLFAMILLTALRIIITGFKLLPF